MGRAEDALEGKTGGWSVPPQDLSEEYSLERCERVEFEGEKRPSLGRVVLLARIGKGATGAVYLGVHPMLRTELAVKLLPQSLLMSHERVLDRFVREARVSAQLRSANLVRVHDAGRDDASGGYYIVMEYVRGVSAVKWRSDHGETPVVEGEALDVCIAATTGLTVAHADGVIHRDVKPGNILIPCDEDDRPLVADAKLTDLGLAHLEFDSHDITASHQGLGTPGFMAPEQISDAKHAREPADVFGMAATMYALLCARRPFAGVNHADCLVKTAIGQYIPPRELRADLSPLTASVIAKGLQKDPADRYPDAEALLVALNLCRERLEQGAD